MATAHTIPRPAGPIIKTTMLILFANGGSSTFTLELAEDPGYDRLRALAGPHIDGDWEHVTVLYQGKRADMFVDGESVRKGLPPNAKATEVYRAAWMAQHPGANPEELPAIYGPAVVFDRQVWW